MAATFDGFRRFVADEFAEVYVVDLGGDVRANPKLSGTKHNVFGIQTGVAITFMVKRRGKKGQSCRIHYARRPEHDTAEEKLAWLGGTPASRVVFDRVEPDAKANWVNQSDNDWDSLLPIADKKTKLAKSKGQDRAIFKQVSFGLASNRDDWAYDLVAERLLEKAAFFIDHYDAGRELWLAAGRNGPVSDYAQEIKWTTELQKYARDGAKIELDEAAPTPALYRPFFKTNVYYRPIYLHRTYQLPTLFPFDHTRDKNPYLCLTDPTAQKPWMALAGDVVPDLHLVGAAAGAVCLMRLRFTSSGEAIDNITDWALAKFSTHYGKPAKITKDDIFHYVYGVLHDPVYRTTYAQNLKRELPRIPLSPDFHQWAGWGKRLMDLHIGYEGVAPWPVTRTDTPDDRARTAGLSPKVILKSDPEGGTITLDSETTLSGIPKQAWDYRLGNRSGLDWILDQHKEKTPKDPTIREKFNTYRFADHKEKVADLIARVTRVSVETVEIVEAMEGAKR